MGTRWRESAEGGSTAGSITWGADRLAVCVCDDGSDGDRLAERPEAAHDGEGDDSIGLKLLQRRAELYGGRLAYHANGAVTVTVEFPLEEQGRDE